MSVNLYNATTDTLKNVAGDIINPKSVNEMIAPIENGTASKDYAVGEQFIMNDLLCEATQPIAQGNTMVIGTNCEESEQLSKQIKDIKSDLTDYSVNTPLRNVTYYNGKLYQLNLDGTIGSEIDGVKRFVGENFAEIGTKEGSALAHTIYGMSVQDGTPTPSVPVEIKSAKADFKCVGKNLIPYPYHSSQSLDAGYVNHGVTIKADSINKNRISFVGTSTGRVDGLIIYPYYDNYLAPGNYKIKVKHISGTNRKVNLALEKGRKGSTTYVSTKARASLDSSTSESTATCIITSDEVKDYSFALALYGMDNQTYDDVYEVSLTLEDADQTYELYKHTDVTTDITLRAIEVASTDNYNLVKDGKYYIADTIDWSEDEGYQITRRIKEIIYNGTESWITNVISGNRHAFFKNLSDNVPPKTQDDVVYAVSSHFSVTSRNNIINNTITNIFGQNASTLDIMFISSDTSITTVAQWKTWLESNNLTVEYILATPTTESITSEQAQALLSLKTYDEASYISSTGSVEPSVDLEYATSEMSAKALTGHNEAYIAQELESVYGVKNFLGLFLRRSDLPAGITTTLTEDGGIHISGQRTDSQTSDWGLNYTIKGLKKGITYKFTCNQYDVPRVGMYYVSSNITKPTTFTWTQDDDGTFTIYIAKGVTYDATIYPMLRLASIQSDEYQPYAMSNHELTVLVKQLQTAVLEMGRN